MMGHDRWVADLRPLLEPLLQARGQALGLTGHPYDHCTKGSRGQQGWSWPMRTADRYARP